jgi:hypothetical protein
MPSRDVAADLRYFVDVLGGTARFAVEGMGARVAMLELAGGPPHLLLADHLEGDRTVHVYRVGDLAGEAAALKRRGVRKQHRLELPMGPCVTFATPGGHRFALYALARPGVVEHFMGRADF